MRHFTSLVSLKKLAGVTAALMILPVAVACSAESDETATGTTSELSASAEDSASTPAESAATDETITGETILDLAMANGSFNTLVSAIEAADLKGQLSEAGEYTVFAPTDEAFAKLPEGILEKLLLPENKEVLMQVLSYHVVAAKLSSSSIEAGEASTVGGETLAVVLDESGGVKVNEATVVESDVIASNGVIHAIDTVLLPPSLDLSTLSSPAE